MEKKKKVLCELCGSEIPPERLEVLPDTTTCVKCSQTKPYSQEEILGLDVAEEQERNRLNVEDFENNTGTLPSYNDEW